MSLISVLLDPVFPVFAIALIGFAMGRPGIVELSDARAVNKIATTFFLPVMLFGLIANAPVNQFEIAPLSIYALAEIILFLFGYSLARFLFRLEIAEAVLVSFCTIFVNHVFFVLPLGIALYGAEHVLPITAIITYDGCILFAAMIIAVQIIRQGVFSAQKTLLTIVKTPLLIGIFAGIAFQLLDLSIPPPVQTFIDFNGVAGPPMAMFALGVVLSKTEFRFDWAVVTFTVLSLLAQPALVWGLMGGVDVSDKARDLVTFTAAGPAGMMAMVLALLYGVRTSLIAQLIVWSSVFSLFTLALLA